MSLTLLRLGILLMVSTITASSKKKPLFTEWEETCMKKYGLQGQLSRDSKDPPSRTVKCYMACSLEREEEINPDGSINRKGGKARILKIFNRKEDKNMQKGLIRIMNQCADKYEILSDMCETVFNYVTCKVDKLTMAAYKLAT